MSEFADVSIRMNVSVGNTPANEPVHARARDAMARPIWADEGASLAAPAIQLGPDQVEWHLTLPPGASLVDAFAYDSPDAFRSDATVERQDELVIVRRIFDRVQPNSLTIVTYVDAEGRRHAVRLRPPGVQSESKSR